MKDSLWLKDCMCPSPTLIPSPSTASSVPEMLLHLNSFSSLYLLFNFAFPPQECECYRFNLAETSLDHNAARYPSVPLFSMHLGRWLALLSLSVVKSLLAKNVLLKQKQSHFRNA